MPSSLVTDEELFSDSNRVSGFPETPCLACGKPFAPLNAWDERCKLCKSLNRPKLKKILNTEFKGKPPLPPERLRFYPIVVDGNKTVRYPSVTSVIHPDGIDFPEALLNQYAARGTIVHKKIEVFLDTQHWPSLEELYKKHADQYLREQIVLMKKGSLKLSPKQCNFLGFYERYSHLFTFNEREKLVVNHQYQFAGRTDCVGTYKGEWAIIDWKTASDYNDEKLESYFMQLAAYASGFEGIKYLVVVPLSPKDPRGFLPPFVSRAVKGHFAKFLVKRANFKAIYGI